MNALILAILTFVGYLLAYNTYGKFLSQKVFKLSNKNQTPAHTYKDGKDFVPSKRHILFGHHFTSIAGTGPIVGPAIGVIWGWGPALIWIFFGSIFMGAVHDFATLVISIRNEGKSIADITEKYINPRVRAMFFVIVFLALLIVIAIFGLVIALIFNQFPQSVIPVWFQLPLSIALGWVLVKHPAKGIGLTLGFVGLLYGSIWIGKLFPIMMPQIENGLLSLPATGGWTIILLIYAAIASVLPVTVLLQPRDYLNAWQLYIALGLLIIGMFATAFSQPFPMIAPALNLDPVGAPPMWPFLFITIACGAISGFHCLVASGTSSKQLEQESDATFVAYGSMLIEAALATLVLIAVTAGISLAYKTGEGTLLSGLPAWEAHYGSWQAMQGLGSKLSAVVLGCSNMLSSLGISFELGITLMGVFIASFAGTTLDSSTRVQRYIISELTAKTPLKALSSKGPATLLAVGTAAALAFSSGADGKGALLLWPLFGSVNQLLAALALMIATVYLKRHNPKYMAITAIPCVLMLGVTVIAVTMNQLSFMQNAQWMPAWINGIILGLTGLMVIETMNVLVKKKGVR